MGGMALFAGYVGPYCAKKRTVNELMDSSGEQMVKLKAI